MKNCSCTSDLWYQTRSSDLTFRNCLQSADQSMRYPPAEKTHELHRVGCLWIWFGVQPKRPGLEGPGVKYCYQSLVKLQKSLKSLDALYESPAVYRS